MLTCTQLLANGFDYLPLNEKVDTLLRECWYFNQRNEKTETAEGLLSLLKTLETELPWTTKRTEKQLIEVMRQIDTIQKQVKNGFTLSQKQLRILAIDIEETLQFHFQRRAIYYQQQKLYNKAETDLREARKAKIFSLYWSRKNFTGNLEEEAKEPVEHFGRGAVLSTGKTFQDIGHGLNQVLGIERFGKRNEPKRQEPGIWE
jgi:hypothetical protein